MEGLARIILKLFLIVKWSSVLVHSVGHFDLLEDLDSDFPDFEDDYHSQQSVNVRELSYKHKENNHSYQSIIK